MTVSQSDNSPLSSPDMASSCVSAASAALRVSERRKMLSISSVQISRGRMPMARKLVSSFWRKEAFFMTARPPAEAPASRAEKASFSSAAQRTG